MLLAVLAFLLGLSLGAGWVFLRFNKKQQQYFKHQTEQEHLTAERDKLLSENQIYKQKEKEAISARKDSEYLKKELENQKQNYEKRMQEKEEIFKKEIDVLKSHHKELDEKSKQLMKTAEDQFKNIANKIFQESTKSYREESTKNLSETLKPFKENIENFKESIQKFTNKEKSMDENINYFREINLKMRDEATKLTQALKGDSKVQGQLGEFSLINILENSGLREGQEFFPQAKGLKLKDEQGNSLRPDILVKLPDKKYIIIDAKVSFTHYYEYLSSETEEQKKDSLKKFLSSVSSHIDNLSSKEYQFAEDIKTSGFTLMFIPNDGIFALATQNSENLFDKAYKKSIIIVSPSTLFATLKTIASIWDREKQNKNAEQIAKQGRSLYNKFAGFLEDMSKIDSGLKTARNSYDEAVNKLKYGRGNLLKQSEKLTNLEGKQKIVRSPDSLIQGVQKLGKNLGMEKDRKEIPVNFKVE